MYVRATRKGYMIYVTLNISKVFLQLQKVGTDEGNGEEK